MYNAREKVHSKMKKAMNQYLQSLADENSRAVVLDAETLLSSAALVESGVCPENIYVVNYEKEIIEKAKLRGHVHSVHGVSTSILHHLKGPFDIIYLDYCGTPEACDSTGFSPQIDLWWAAANLQSRGRIVCTFSKRCARAIQKAQEIIPSGLAISTIVEYCETSPMFTMVLTNRMDPRCDLLYLYYPVNHKYKVGDLVRVDYIMTDGRTEQFVGGVMSVCRDKESYKYLLQWENDAPTYVREENITKKLYIL